MDSGEENARTAVGQLPEELRCAIVAALQATNAQMAYDLAPAWWCESFRDGNFVELLRALLKSNRVTSAIPMGTATNLLDIVHYNAYLY